MSRHDEEQKNLSCQHPSHAILLGCTALEKETLCGEHWKKDKVMRFWGRQEYSACGLHGEESICVNSAFEINHVKPHNTLNLGKKGYYSLEKALGDN